MSPAVTAAGPRPSVDHTSAEGLRAEVQNLRHSISFALPALAPHPRPPHRSRPRRPPRRRHRRPDRRDQHDRKHDMSDTPDPTPTSVVVNAEEFAHAWGIVTRACDDADNRPILAGVQIDVYGPNTLRLTATNSYQLYTCVVGPRTNVDDLDAEPDSTWLVNPLRPVSRRLLRQTYPPSTVTLTFDEAGVRIDVVLDIPPTLPGGIQLPAVEGEYVPWRELVRKSIAKTEAGSDGRVHLGPHALAGLVELVTIDRPIELRIAGPLDPVVVRLAGCGLPPVLGMIMPMRSS